LRGVFDAAMSVYLDLFLNVPAAPLLEPDDTVRNPEALLQELPALLDRQQPVNEAGTFVARYLYGGGVPDRLLAMLGNVLLREDRDFHTIQVIEGAARQHALFPGTPAGSHALIAAALYLAVLRPPFARKNRPPRSPTAFPEASTCLRDSGRLAKLFDAGPDWPGKTTRV
jgi:hypothetical protein